MVRESRLHPDDLIAPLFVKEGADAPVPIASLPGQFQHTRDSLRQEVREIKDLGVPAVVLFGVPKQRILKALRRGTPTASSSSPFRT